MHLSLRNQAFLKFSLRSVRKVQNPALKIVPDVSLIGQLTYIMDELSQKIGYLHDGYRMDRGKINADLGSKAFAEIIGYSLKLCSGHTGGVGVVINDGSEVKGENSQESTVRSVTVASRGQIMGIYPGTVYLPKYKPPFRNGIFNPYMFQRQDGILIDGSHRFFSKLTFELSAECDSREPFPFCDKSWYTKHSVVPLNICQHVRNECEGHPSNTHFQELEIPIHKFREPMKRLLPNVLYRSDFQSMENQPIKTVVLVATRELKNNEELFSSYYTADYC